MTGYCVRSLRIRHLKEAECQDVWSNRVHNVNEVTPVAAKTARRHFKAMVEDKPLNALA